VDSKQFEADVVHLLTLLGWQVLPETLVGAKKVDALAKRLGDFGQHQTMAIECKAYHSNLTQEQVNTIYSNYRPLLDSGRCDQLLLVTLEPLAPSANTFVADARGLVHVTYLTLLNSLLDFSGYVDGMIAQFEGADVSAYYIKQDCRSDATSLRYHTCAEDAIVRWVSEDNFQPVAILAGYGMGKTTLSRRLAYVLASQHKGDARARIPLLLKLEELGSEQSLEGLIGKHFTSFSVVRNYNFNLFYDLLKRGRFVVILDGFDEMKHTMSWETMRFNFQQLNRLVTGRSKVLLSGRPSAFLTENEQMEALHGVARGTTRTFRIPDWPDYQELHLLPFTRDQIAKFIGEYISERANRGVSMQHLTPSVDDLTDDSHIYRLASRPVQLKMLLEVLPIWDKRLDSLTVSALYSIFIDLLIKREMDKLSRRLFSQVERREFARDLAWWMWTENNVTGISGARIPDVLFERFKRRDADIGEVRRDLLTACSIDRKAPEGYYFPHRSFQEFLVAEHLVELAKSGKLPIEGTSILITQEIREFFAGMIGLAEKKRFKAWLWDHRGTLLDWPLDLMLDLYRDASELIADDGAMNSPWGYALVVQGIRTKRWSTDEATVAEFIRSRLGTIPAGCTQRDRWARLLVVLNVLMSDAVLSLGIEQNGRLLDLLGSAGTAAGLVGGRKVPAADVISANSTREFCFVQSWRESLAGAVKWYSLGRGDSSGETDKKKEVRKKSPHKQRGVTPKHRYPKLNKTESL
jgi:hypothetical protein